MTEHVLLLSHTISVVVADGLCAKLGNLLRCSSYLPQKDNTDFKIHSPFLQHGFEEHCFAYPWFIFCDSLHVEHWVVSLIHGLDDLSTHSWGTKPTFGAYHPAVQYSTEGLPLCARKELEVGANIKNALFEQ